jgi:hypothetical protein
VLKWDEEKEFKFIDYVKAAEQVFSKRKKEPGDRRKATA